MSLVSFAAQNVNKKIATVLQDLLLEKDALSANHRDVSNEKRDVMQEFSTTHAQEIIQCVQRICSSLCVGSVKMLIYSKKQQQPVS